MSDNSIPNSSGGALSTYLSEINRYPVLKHDEEQTLARRFRDHGDAQAGHRLVTANLRFVVKVSFEYRSYGLRMSDLIQEGNLGLMKAVQKFDPDKGIRLISYAVWWIRAFVQNHILQSWSLVKIGTTQAQRKLFFSLARTKREIERMTGEPVKDPRLIAKRLRVRATEVVEMERRLDGRDLSLDAPLDAESGGSHLDLLSSTSGGHDDELADLQQRQLIGLEVRQALEVLQPRERFIVENRLLSETPMTYIEIGRHFGFSRERARQLELRARARLKAALERFRDTLDADSSEAALQWRL